MYSFSISRQAWLFLYSFGFGFALCLLYDSIRMLRKLFGEKTWVLIIQDVLFFALSAFAVFSFLLVIDYGSIRFYSLSALVLGFLVCALSFGQVVISVSDKIILLFNKILTIVTWPFKKLFSHIFPCFNKTQVFLKKNLIEFKNKLKLLLQKGKQ